MGIIIVCATTIFLYKVVIRGVIEDVCVQYKIQMMQKIDFPRDYFRSDPTP